jgi:hypothetical protein
MRSKHHLARKSNVEVVRRGLRLLRDVTEREALREAYRHASRATRASLSRELNALDHLANEGLCRSQPRRGTGDGPPEPRVLAEVDEKLRRLGEL